MMALAKATASRLYKHSVFIMFAILFAVSVQAPAQVNVEKPHQVDVLILTGPGGHNLAADNVQNRLTAAGLSYARFDFSSLSAWTFEQTLEMLETNPEQANEYYRDYYAQAKVAKSPADLPQGEWHSAEQLMSVLSLVKPRLILSTYAISMESVARLTKNKKIANIPVGLDSDRLPP